MASFDTFDDLVKTISGRQNVPEGSYAQTWGNLADRLARVSDQLPSFSAAAGLSLEISACSRLVESDDNLAHLALLAIERRIDGLALIASVMPIIERDRRRQDGCRKGGLSADKSKLPPRDRLEVEAIQLVTNRLLPARAVRKTLAYKYGVTPEAVGKVLRSASR